MSRRLTRPPPPPPTATAWWALEALREQEEWLSMSEMATYLHRATGLRWRWMDIRRLVASAYRTHCPAGRSPLDLLHMRRR